jgi:hypothetical protein
MPDLSTCLVRIIDTNGNTSGAGFVLSNDGLIATCAHVIESAGAGPGDLVDLFFHGTEGQAAAMVEPDGWRAPEQEDIAILRLKGSLPENVEPLPLGHSKETANHNFETFGFPDANPVDGLLGGGLILGQTRLNGVWVLQLRSQEVTGGFSGAPVFDLDRQQIVGMITATAEPDRRGRLGETAFITPMEEIAAAWPGLILQPVPDLVGLKLEAYRQQLLDDPQNKYVNLKGIVSPLEERQWRMPLDRVYIRLQALEQEKAQRQRKAEQEALTEEQSEGQPDEKKRSQFDLLAYIRAIGEEMYRRGQTSYSEARPDPVDPLEALQTQRRLVILGAPGSGKSTLLRYIIRRTAEQPTGFPPSDLSGVCGCLLPSPGLAKECCRNLALAQAPVTRSHLTGAAVAHGG